MKIGYARVSTAEQNLDLQRDALKAAGCEKVITDKASGATAARPGLEKVKELLRAGDTLVVWRLDRLGRSLRDLIGWMTYLDEEKVGLLSLHEAIDTTTTSGKLTFHLFGALAEFERNLIRFFKRPVVDELIECELLRFSHEASPLLTAFAASCHLGCFVQPVSRHFQRPADRARFSRITSHRNSPTGPAMKVATRIGAWTSREKFFASASRAIHSPTKRSKAR